MIRKEKNLLGDYDQVIDLTYPIILIGVSLIVIGVCILV